MRPQFLICLMAVICPTATLADSAGKFELSLYGTAADGVEAMISGDEPGGLGQFSFGTGLTSGQPAGLRVTWWRENGFGWGLDMNNHQTPQIAEDLAGTGVDALEFGNDRRTVTLNAYRRWTDAPFSLTPYFGAGVGLSVGEVDFDGAGAPDTTRKSVGPAVQLLAGASVPVGGNVSLFGEFFGAYSVTGNDLAGGGDLTARQFSNGVNVGLSFGF